jgi:hypothetical protein
LKGNKNIKENKSFYFLPFTLETQELLAQKSLMCRQTVSTSLAIIKPVFGNT